MRTCVLVLETPWGLTAGLQEFQSLLYINLANLHLQKGDFSHAQVCHFLPVPLCSVLTPAQQCIKQAESVPSRSPAASRALFLLVCLNSPIPGDDLTYLFT